MRPLACLFALILPGLAGCRPSAPLRCTDCAERDAPLQAWRATRLAALRGEQGWLALAGLHWLGPGAHRLGADPGADIVFPAGAPAEVGTLTLRGGEIHLQVAPGVDARLNGAPITATDLHTDADPARPADRVQLGARFTFLVIARGERLGLRIYDRESPARREFTGITHFPARPAWRVQARFEPFTPPRRIDHPTAIGTVQPAEVPGVAVFTVESREYRLTPILEHGPDGPELLFVFRDRTSGVETYTGGRFLIARMPEDGVVELDFNRAHNPPCAFTEYATCPLPLAENRLALRVEAGEKTPTAHAP